MKPLHLLNCSAAALMLTALSVHARNVTSPDGRFAVRAEAEILLIDSAGEPLLTLIRNTAADTRVEVAWSTDSRRVVIVENTARSCDIIAAYQDAGVWHKTIELDSDQAALIRQAQLDVGGRLVSEQQTLGQWVSETAVQVHGTMTFSSGHHVAYQYVLEFGTGPGRLDRGGYEEGVIRGVRYQLH